MSILDFLSSFLPHKDPALKIDEDLNSSSPFSDSKIPDSKKNEEDIRVEKEKLLASQKLYNELINKAQETEKQNMALEDTKKAMLNLLEDEKKLEVSLKEEKDRISAIVASMGEGLFVLDEKHQIVLMNPIAENLLEIKAVDVYGKNWAEVVTTYNGDVKIPLEERSTVSSLKVGKVIVTNLEDNHYYLTKSGKKFPVTSTTTPLVKDNKVVGAIKVFRDATSDKLSKQKVEEEVVKRTSELTIAKDRISEGWLKLQEEKAKLTSAISSLPRAFAIIDSGGQITTTNGQFESIFGIQKEKWSINLIDKLLDNKLALNEKTSNALINKKSVDIDDIEFGAKFIGIFVAPIIGDDKKVVGAILTIKDITEDKIRERSKDEFFSIASHELRTPLTAIRGNMSMIQDYYKEQIKDPELKIMITDTYDASIRLIGIVNDFLDLSRLEQKRMEFKLTSFKLNDVVLNVLKDLKATADEKKISLVSNISDQIMVTADADKLKEILFNLAGNSLKFTQQGSVTVSAETLDNLTKIRIIDTGAGIPIANQALLFHKFQQATSSTITRDGAKGTGLGLYISKLMVEGMGGTIGLESSVEGKGSVFVFSLPVATETIKN